jgi:HK97 family phage portal protein
MGIMQRLAGALGYERRGAGIGVDGWPTAGTISSAGYSVSASLAENLSTTTACVNAIASALASLPPFVYRLANDGRAEDPAHPVARLIRAPNAFQSWPDWIELTMGEVLLQGNALSIIESDVAGNPTALVPVPWQNVSVQLLPSGRLAYDVMTYQAPFGGTGRPQRLLADQVFHLKDRGDNPYVGRSRISRAPEVLGNALALQEFNGAMWKNQATPCGAIEIESGLTQPHFDRLREQFSQRHTGAHNARNVLILDNKAKWTPLSVSPEDAEVLASRRFSVEELARLFGVPAPIIGDLSHGTFTNAETTGRWFAMFTLAPWCRKLEAEFSRSVFATPDRHLEIDLSGLQRGSYAERWQANVAAVDAGILDANEVREAEGYNPRPAPAGGPPVAE